MFKLVILIEKVEDEAAFEASWPEFLGQAEQMPGLIKETFSPVFAKLHGENEVMFIHELYFESPDALHAAMASPEGQKAGQTLQSLTNGRVTLLFADHLEDNLKHIRRFKQDKASKEDD